MNYKETLQSDYWDRYVNCHKSILSNLGIMMFEITYLRELYSWKHKLAQTLSLSGFHEYLHITLFSELISNCNKCFFDRKNSITVTRFKGDILKYCQEKPKIQLLKLINDSKWNTKELKKLREKIGTQIIQFRNQRIAHNLYSPELDVTVNLDDIESIFNAGCDLFCRLTFSPNSFYSKHDMSGYDFNFESANLFNKEQTIIKKDLARQLQSQLTLSPMVTAISFEYDTSYGADEIELLKKELENMNQDKNRHSSARHP